MTTPSIVVAGVGNLHRGDDGVGPAVVGRLRDDLPESVATLSPVEDPLRLIDAWDGAELAVVIDAVVSGAKPGTIHVLDAADGVPGMFERLSTHAFGVAQVIELGRVLGRMPHRLVVIGVEAGHVGRGGVGLTPPVAAATGDVARRVRALIAEHQPPVTSDGVKGA